MFNGHKGGGDPEGDHENGEGDSIASKGQRSVLKGEPLDEGEPDFFESPISILSIAFTTNTKNNKHNFFH